MQDQDTSCKGCDGDCRDCDGQVVWQGRGRKPVYCCHRCANRDKSAESRARIRERAPKCTHPGCTKIRKHQTGQGLCGMHYRRWLKGEDMDAPPKKVPLAEHRPCRVEGCDKRYFAKDLCRLHYNRLRVNGEVGPAGLVQAAPGTRSEWTDPKSGYIYVYTAGDRRRAQLKQRVVMAELLGRELLPTETVHHINGDRADNMTNGPLVNFRSGNLELWESTHPKGQRVADKLEWAASLIRKYAPEALNEEALSAALIQGSTEGNPDGREVH